MIHNIAHRGASAYEPENTLRAFERAIDMGVTMLEVDVHLSRDGHPVVIHSADLSRTTNGQGLVSDLALAQIRHLDAGLAEPVPTLAEVVDLARGRVQLYLELKGQRTPEPVVRVLRAAAFEDQLIISSFYPGLTQKGKFLSSASRRHAVPAQCSCGVRTSMLVRREDRHRDFGMGAGSRGRLRAFLLGERVAHAAQTAHASADCFDPAEGSRRSRLA